MGIVLGKINSVTTVARPRQTDVRPPVPGAVRLTALEMNMLHFGSDRHSPVPGK